jgi:hypothetical protein
LKRLLFYLNHITESNTATFRYTVKADGKPVQKEIYDGECNVVYLKPSGEAVTDREGTRREPAYWRDGISYTFERTDRLSVSRPTVIVSIPAERLGVTEFTPAAADCCLREIAPYFDGVNEKYANKSRPDSDNGKFFLHKPGGEVLLRNGAYFSLCPAKDYENGSGAEIYVTKFLDAPPDRMCLCVRMEIQLPHGKLNRAKKMLTGHLPDETERFVREFDREKLAEALALEKTQHEIRQFLRENPYCAFIANGSILAREKGTDLPMAASIPFKSAPEDEIEIAGVRGMGVKRGVTVITGGGYSGKSTVLNAISAGIYNHAAGDGRELCLTDASAATVTAEDGRAVSRLNISPFIKWAQGGDTRAFSTEHASGSTSQAANIMEAVESGAKLLLIDEDRSATNFMIRDALMKELIKKEPVTPFTDRVRELAGRGVSTVLVIGGSSEYLAVADKILMMDDFKMSDITGPAQNLIPKRLDAQTEHADWVVSRHMGGEGFTSYPNGGGTERLEVSDTGFVIIGDERIDVRYLHGIETPGQVSALAFILRYLTKSGDAQPMDALEARALLMRGVVKKVESRTLDIAGRLDELYGLISERGIALVDTGFFAGMNRFLDLPRKQEVRAAINRMRGVEWV